MREMTIQQDFQLEGAAKVMERYAQHTARKVNAVVRNYEAADFNQVAFLADCAYCLDNARVVLEAAETIEEIIKQMRAEVSPIFEQEEEEQGHEE